MWVEEIRRINPMCLEVVFSKAIVLAKTIGPKAVAEHLLESVEDLVNLGNAKMLLNDLGQNLLHLGRDEDAVTIYNYLMILDDEGGYPLLELDFEELSFEELGDRLDGLGLNINYFVEMGVRFISLCHEIEDHEKRDEVFQLGFGMLPPSMKEKIVSHFMEFPENKYQN